MKWNGMYVDLLNDDTYPSGYIKHVTEVKIMSGSELWFNSLTPSDAYMRQ